MHTSLQDIFERYFDAYAAQRRVCAREQRAAWCIRHCFSAAMGGHVLACPAGHYSVLQYHACRHRSCPRCADSARQHWLQGQLAQLLPCPHFHVVFTLPHELLALWEFNRSRMTQMLFDCARSSLLTLCAEPRLLGATPGVLLALHTWGRTLSRHPHVHCLVSAGGIDAQELWRASRPDFLLPLKPLQRLWRGKLLCALGQALRTQRLRLPPSQDSSHWRRTFARLWRKHCNVQINPPYPHGRGVALYLARYAKGGPLPQQRALDVHAHRVSFGYTDHRDGQTKTLSLDAHEFISRILWHAPPAGQHTVRRAGLYASSHSRHHALCRAQLTPSPSPEPLRPLACHSPHRPPLALCPTCHSPLTRQRLLPTAHQDGEISRPAQPHRPATLGPTQRSSGQTPAGDDMTLRRRLSAPAFAA